MVPSEVIPRFIKFAISNVPEQRGIIPRFSRIKYRRISEAGYKSYLESFINYELTLDQSPHRVFKLQRIQKLFELLGNPQKKLKVIHIAGTKGKGSCAVFTAGVLACAGYKVGLYTSPHLSDLKERIRILSPRQMTSSIPGPFAGKITNSQLIKVLKEIKFALEKLRVDAKLGRLSYFEVLTAVAVYHFVQKRVDFAVLETGLGGRLDATNAVESLVCAITPVSLDHTRQLGKTLALIAREKAAIIKRSHQRVVVAPQPKAAEVVIRNRCREFKSSVLWIGNDIRHEVLSQNLREQIFSLKGFDRDYDRLKSRLLGDYQCVNAAVSVGIIEFLRKEGFEVSDEAIYRGIAQTTWPGRFEILGKDPYVILDGAHNPDSAQILAVAVRKIFPKKRIILVLGMSQDKDLRGIVRPLNALADKIIFTRADNPRAVLLNEDQLKELFPGKEIFSIPKVRDAVKISLKDSGQGDVVLVTGSLFVVAQAREYLNICTK